MTLVSKLILKHWNRLSRSLSRQYREWRLPCGYLRLGTRYGGWWINSQILSASPLLIDCGLGEDLSFPAAFLGRFGGKALGVEPNPRSLDYCYRHLPMSMDMLPAALWKRAGDRLTFHLPRDQSLLPPGADGVSGSLLASHEYVGGGMTLAVETINLDGLLRHAKQPECDVLKLDIEGAEYEVLADLCLTGQLRRTRQLLVEFHHRVTQHTIEDTIKTVAEVTAAGFTLVHVEGRNHVFSRNSEATGR